MNKFIYQWKVLYIEPSTSDTNAFSAVLNSNNILATHCQHFVSIIIKLKALICLIARA